MGDSVSAGRKRVNEGENSIWAFLLGLHFTVIRLDYGAKSRNALWVAAKRSSFTGLTAITGIAAPAS